jgi:hypothetical protein
MESTILKMGAGKEEIIEKKTGMENKFFKILGIII